MFPPFVAPPTDGRRQRRWLALGLAGGAALVLCVGGLFGLAALVVFGNQMVVEQSQSAVSNYLTAIKNQNYGQAYDQMCAAERNRISRTQFVSVFEAQPRIDSFRVAQPQINETFVVPATIVYADGSAQTIKYRVEQDASTSDFEVCGEVN